MTYINTLKTIFTERQNVFKMKTTKNPLISKNDKILGKKKARKFLGRNRTKRNKSTSKRKNNYKTFNARKILASRHGISNALQKRDNKYILTYGDIAKLMRKYHYVFNRSLGKWDEKEPKEKVKQEQPHQREPKNTPQSSPSQVSHKEPKNKDVHTKNITKPTPLATFSLPEKPINKEHKDRLKSLQARIILISQGEQGYANYVINDGHIDFTINNNATIQRMHDKNMLWLKKKDKWVDYKGKDPNDLEGYKGTLGRAILVHSGQYSFLSFEEENLEFVEEKLEDLGYEWLEGSWVNTEEETLKENDISGDEEATRVSQLRQNGRHNSPLDAEWYNDYAKKGPYVEIQLDPEQLYTEFDQQDGEPSQDRQGIIGNYMNRNTPFPAVNVRITYRDNEPIFFVVDGNTRVEAARQKGDKSIAVRIPKVQWNEYNSRMKEVKEAAGTSSSPANAGPGFNSQGIAPFSARLGTKIKKRVFSEEIV